MRLHMLAIGTRMPKWVQAGVEEYATRLPKESQLILKEVAVKAGKNETPETRIEYEYQRLIAAKPLSCLQVALDRRGQHWSTQRLSDEFDVWLHSGKDVALIIGGADGLPQRCMTESDSCWALSELTLPHMLVRIIVAEQLYRAFSFLNNHPYHRK